MPWACGGRREWRGAGEGQKSERARSGLVADQDQADAGQQPICLRPRRRACSSRVAMPCSREHASDPSCSRRRVGPWQTSCRKTDGHGPDARPCAEFGCAARTNRAQNGVRPALAAVLGLGHPARAISSPPRLDAAAGVLRATCRPPRQLDASRCPRLQTLIWPQWLCSWAPACSKPWRTMRRRATTWSAPHRVRTAATSARASCAA